MVKKPNGRGRSDTETKNSCRSRIKKEIKETQKDKMGMSSNFGLSFVPCFDNFIGCFPEDVLKTVSFRSFPVFLIINLDKSGMHGSHWIALGIFKKSIEVFDPLGFEIFNWPRVPCNLLSFLHQHSTNRDLHFARRLQSNNSTLCGFYCLYYVMKRSQTSLQRIQSKFSSTVENNDNILLTLF